MMRCGYCKNEGHNSRTCGDKKKVLFMPARFPQKFTPGDMIRFVPAPPRYAGEKPRFNDLVGETGIILSDTSTAYKDDPHGWGGVYKICFQSGEIGRYYGDFLSLISRGA